MRQAILALAKDTEFAKRVLNGGRLSVPSVYDTPLSSPDVDSWAGGPPPGASLIDAPLQDRGRAAYLSDAFTENRDGFVLLQFANGAPAQIGEGVCRVQIGGNGLADSEGLAAMRYDATPGAAYLLRPDGYVAARFRHPSRETVAAAVRRASGLQ